MRKVFPLILILALLLGWSVAWAVDGRSETNIPDPLKQSLDQDKMDILRSLTRSIKPSAPSAVQAPGPKTPVPNYIKFLPREERLILTDYVSDDFDDGDYNGWTLVSNGDGTGLEDWAIHPDPWIDDYWEIENHGSGFFVGSDSDGGGSGSTTDEELSIDFSTPVGGQLNMDYWLWMRSYNLGDDYFEVLIDGEQVDLVQPADDTPVVGVRSIILDDYADGETHTLTMHYYAEWGYACAFDDVVITDEPCVVECPDGGIPEGEPDCYDGYDDEYNVGCNAEPPVDPIWTEISCGDVICGRSGVYDYDGQTRRDTDWYTFDLLVPSDVTVTMTGEFPVQLLFFHIANNCDDYEYTGYTGGRCQTVSYNDRLHPGTYWLWCGPSDWFAEMVCDGSGGLGVNYVLTLECVPTPPCEADVVIGDINANLPYSTSGTTCGYVNDWDETCLGTYDTGEDIIYEFTVTVPITLNITLDPNGQRYSGILVDDFCPPDDADCVASITYNGGDAYGFENLFLMEGTYWLMIDTQTPGCLTAFDLNIEEGLLLLALAETENIPDCGVSAMGPLGETDAQGNTYSWNGNYAANFAGTFVMGDGPTRMFSYYNFGTSDCYTCEPVVGLDMSDPYNPTSQYSDGGVMGGVDISYEGFGFEPPTAMGDVFVHTFTITNNSGETISDYYAGVYFDWDIGYEADPQQPDTVAFKRDLNLMYQGLFDLSYIFGLCLINDDEVNLQSMTGVSQNDYIYIGGWFMEDLYNLMSHDGDQIADDWYDDMSSLFSTGPHTLNDGESVTIEIAVIGAGNRNDMEALAGIIGQLDIVNGEIVGPSGACCDDNTADCNEDVFILDCDGTRFAADGVCGDLDPACGEIPSCEYTPGDCNCNGTPLELGDVVAMIAQYRGTSPVCYTCECPPHGENFAANADPTGNCVALELGDVVREIAAYRGTATALGCSDCPPPGRIAPGGDRTTVVPSLKSKVRIDRNSQ